VAVDFLHRLIVTGPVEQVRALRRELYREYPRTLGDETWTEIVPFCFAALYDIAPAARRVEKEVPYDPYEISVWPVRRLSARRAELRYQFQTRNLEMAGLVRALARARPSLRFTLGTLCLDDSEVDGYRFTGRTAQRWRMPSRAVAHLWNRARQKFDLEGDDVYDDDDAEHWVEEESFEQTLGHWEGSRRRRLRWWDRPSVRDIGTERELAMYELLAESFGEPDEPRTKSKKEPRTKKKTATRRRPPSERTTSGSRT
jgi:hypothetical protein